MSQRSERHCPNCGNLVPTGQRFCTNCGTALEGRQQSTPPPNQPSQQQQPYYPQYPRGNSQVPPYAQSPQGNQPIPPYAQSQQPQNPVGEAVGALGLLYLLRRGRRGAWGGRRRQSNGCCSCLVMLFILAIIGVPLFFVFRSAGSSFISKNFNSIYGKNTLATQPPISTTPINEKVTYAGVDITVVSAEQSLAFIDDHNTYTDGMVRLNLHEQNSSSSGSYYYGDIARLILPGGNSIAPVNSQQSFKPAAGVSRLNWLDFPVPMSDKISQLTLRLGKDSEAQMDIPLTGHANLNQYLPKTVSPNVTTQYSGLNWTITSATSSWSNQGMQATKGMMYVTLTLKIDNPSSTDFNRYWGDYIRLKSGETTSPPALDTTVPLSIPAGSSGAKGNVTFLMPQSNTSFTLILLGNTSTQVSQATANFQLA